MPRKDPVARQAYQQEYYQRNRESLERAERPDWIESVQSYLAKYQ